MKRMFCFAFALVLLLGCLTGCRSTGRGESPTEKSPVPQTVPVLPEETMPTKPEADYQIPPGEKPGSGNVQTH